MIARSVPRPEAIDCPCGGLMRPGRRYETTRTVDVLICWRCGEESPPLYGARPPVPTPSYCRWCGERFAATDPRERYCSDDHARRGDRITLDRRFTGRQMRRRPA